MHFSCLDVCLQLFSLKAGLLYIFVATTIYLSDLAEHHFLIRLDQLRSGNQAADSVCARHISCPEFPKGMQFGITLSSLNLFIIVGLPPWPTEGL
jgi:hypothetical protein